MRVVVALPGLLLLACGRGDVDRSWRPRSGSAVAGVPIASVRAEIQRRLAAARPPELSDDRWRHTQRLYQQFAEGPLWFDDSGLDKQRSAALTNALLDADTDGLRLEAYPVAELARALATLHAARRVTAAQIADADLMLSSSFAALGEDLLTGQVDPKSISQSWYINPQEDHVDSALVASLHSPSLDSAMARMRPRDPDYDALRHRLVRFRQLATRGGWAAVPGGAADKPGQTDQPARLAALRRRLAAEGLLIVGDTSPDSAAGMSSTYDRGLAGAVARFQAMHGINVDSVIGRETIASLNVPVSYRVGQIAANLERFRWLPRTLGPRYIFVNVPAFRLQAFDTGKPVMEMKVIVGAEYNNRATPTFSDSMHYVVFRPYWLITDSIAAKEVFPKAHADTGYLARNDIELYSDHGTQRVRQKPGPKNSLGLVKFIFPNTFDIYLHDTPEGALFNKDVRAFSHGCIRVQHPDRLGAWVLGWDLERVRQAMQQGPDNHTVQLHTKIPVYIAYFTAYTLDRQLYFGNDLYKRDDALVNAVGSGAMPGPDAVQALEALRRVASS